MLEIQDERGLAKLPVIRRHKDDCPTSLISDFAEDSLFADRLESQAPRTMVSSVTAHCKEKTYEKFSRIQNRPR
jgi:hypothetical protein